MTDITDQDLCKALAWAEGSMARGGADAADRYILATVDAPEPTLTERLREQFYYPEQNDEQHGIILDAAQMEHDLAEARAEVERLTAERDARPATTLPDPDDVPYGEAWLVEVNGGTVPAIKAGRRRWVYPGAGGYWNSPVVGDWFTLVSRLVPAPRQITTREELDALPRRTVIRDKDGVVCERTSLGEAWYSPESTTDQTHYITFPATVLWAPEVAK